MAAVDQITTSDLGPGLGGFGTAVLDDIKNRLLDEVKRAGWRWYEANADRVLYQRKVLFWTLSLRVRDLRWIFEELFDPEPLP